MITQAELKRLVHYDPETGAFIALVDRGGTCRTGNVLGGTSSYSYLRMSINGKSYLSHRLAWLYVYGEFPRDQLDHIDHDRKNNRINNLRNATNKENQKNRSKGKNNASGFIGVVWNEAHKRWYARLKLDGKNKHLGGFASKSEAIAARKAANIKYGFHENHGE